MGKHKTSDDQRDIGEWVNYQGKITGQSAEPGYLVVYNAAGSNIASALVDTHTLPAINGAQPKGFVLDHTAYWYRTDQLEEAHYVYAVLNAPCVDAAIKAGSNTWALWAHAMFTAAHSRSAPSPPLTRTTPITSGWRN